MNPHTLVAVIPAAASFPTSLFGQTFEPGDLAVVAVLIALEALLSIDNALVLGVIARRVEPRLRGKALSYGLLGALLLRLAAVGLAAYLLRWPVLKLGGGLYLLWVAIRYFWSHASAREQGLHAPPVSGRLWPTIVAIELTDLAFAADSILAAVALVGAGPPGVVHPKLWVIIVGAMSGVVLMRFAAAGFARLLDRFPGLHRSAFLLVAVIGIKLIIDWAVNSPDQPHRVDFQDPARSPMWIFWGAMLLCLALGLFRRSPPKPASL